MRRMSEIGRVCVYVVASVALASGACKKKEEPAPKPTAMTAENPAPPAKSPEPPVPSAPSAPSAQDKLVERGAYIAKAGACVICHTAIGPTGPDVEHAFGGGLEMPDPMGTWRTPNITQDKGTGIGNWTDAQIAASIREGVRPDGSQLYAIMPYMNYNRMTDDDTNALVAFLRTIKPVERVVAPNKDLKIPKIPAPKPANQPDVTADPLKHGEYLATLMLCNHCHWTPDKNFAPAGPDKLFSGGLPITAPMLGKGTIYTANITPDVETGIGKYTEDQIFTTIKTMQKLDGTLIRGPMLFMQTTWSQLDEGDLRAVAKFIKQLPPVKNKVPASDFVANAPPPAPPGGASPAAGSDTPVGDTPVGDKPAGNKPAPAPKQGMKRGEGKDRIAPAAK